MFSPSPVKFGPEPKTILQIPPELYCRIRVFHSVADNGVSGLFFLLSAVVPFLLLQVFWIIARLVGFMSEDVNISVGGLDHDTVDNPRQPGGGPSLYRVYPCGKLPVGQVFSKPELHIISFKAAIPCMDNSFNRLVTNHSTGWQNLPQFTRCRKVSHCSCCFRVSKGSGSESRPQVPRTESRRACWIFDTEIWPQKPIFSNVFECCFCFEFCSNFSGIPS